MDRLAPAMHLVLQRAHLCLVPRRSDRMFRSGAARSRSVEYSIVIGPRRAGPTIGVYEGLPVAERVVDQFGRLFAYVGVACRRSDGQFDAARLGPGEFIIEPGLAYRLESATPAS